MNPKSYVSPFSLNQQTDIQTPVADAKLNKLRTSRSFNPITMVPQRISNRGDYGAGHSHATYNDLITKMFELGAKERSCSAMDILYAGAFVMGDLTSAQPAPIPQPSEWLHTLRWQSLITNEEVLYTCFGEEMANLYKKILSGGFLRSFSLAGNRNDHVVISYEGAGRKYVDGTFTSPAAPTPSAFLKTLFGTLSFGPTGAPVDISAQVVNWNLTFNQNPDPQPFMGNPDGEKELLSNVFIGEQTVTGSVTIRIAVEHRDRFLNDNLVALTIVCKSKELMDVNPHTATVTLPRGIIAAETFGIEGQFVTYTMNYDEDTWLKGALDHVKLDVLTNVDDTEILVVSQPPP